MYQKIDNVIVDRVGESCAEKCFKFVGHLIDENLTWSYHIKEIARKLTFTNFTIRRLKNVLPLSGRFMLYNSLFKSYLEYGILAFGGVPKKRLKVLCKLQKRCFASVVGSKSVGNSNRLLCDLRLLNFDRLFELNCCKFMFQYSQGKLPDSFKGLFTLLSGRNRTKSYVTTRPINLFTRQFPIEFLPRVWNGKAMGIKNAKSIYELKTNFYSECFSKH